jgi:hypothetical protein
LVAAGFFADDFFGAGFVADDPALLLQLPALFPALQLAPAFVLLWLQVAPLVPFCVPAQAPSLWRLQLPPLAAVFALLV